MNQSNRHGLTTFHFKGGVTLPLNADSALDLPILDMPLPERLVYPLQSRKGSRQQPVVASGDCVVLGQVLAEPHELGDVPLLASASGTVELGDHSITLKTDAQQKTALEICQHNITDQLQALGVQGLGGGAFSCSAKLHSSGLDSAPGNDIDTLIINAAECEPMICCDQALIREQALEVMHAIALLAGLLGVKHCLVGIEDSMQQEFELLANALQAHRQTGTTEQAIASGDSVPLCIEPIELVSIPTRYPTGGEKQLIRVLTGLQLAPADLPRDHGLLCFNIATALAVKQALINHRAQIDRIVTLTGEAIAEPRNVRARFGTRLSDLLLWLDPALDIASQTKMTITLGGPMSGVPVDITQISISAASNCIVVAPSRAAPVAMPCIRCGECDKVCPAGLLPQQLHWYCRSENLADAEKFNLSACIECGCCDYVCPSSIPLTAQFRHGKMLAAEQLRLASLASKAQQRSQARDLRLAHKEQTRQTRLQQRKLALEQKRSKRRVRPDAMQAKTDNTTPSSESDPGIGN